MRTATRLLVCLLIGLGLSILFVALRAPAEGAVVGPATQHESSLPGLWFRSGHYEDLHLDHEPSTPSHAVIAGIFQDGDRAEHASLVLDRATLSLGFPWVVANHDLRIAGHCGDGIVVVFGLFETRRAADAWLASDQARASLQVAALEPDGSDVCGWHFAQGGWIVDHEGRRIDAVHIDPSSDAPAYAPSALEEMGDDRQDHELASRRLATTPIACTIPRGSVGSPGTELEFAL